MAVNEPVNQVGGDHYETDGLEHWDYVEQMGMGYLEGCATKYICRGGKKTPNPVMDYQKGRSYLEKLLHEHSSGRRNNRCLYAYGKPHPPMSPEDLAGPYRLTGNGIRVVTLATYWTMASELRKAIEIVTRMIEDAEREYGKA